MKKIIYLLVMLLPVLGFAQSKSHSVPFTFKLGASASTSAGVYTADGVLLRTLWSGVKYNAGTFTENWDGLDDDGRLLANGKYTVKVLSNNVNYAWEGVVGNTSVDKTGSNVIRALDQLAGMFVVGNTAYCAASYNEGQSSQMKINTASPQSKISILAQTHKTSQATFFTASDGVNVYWGGYDPFSNTNHFVFATKALDDQETTFSSGTALQMTYGRKYTSVINHINSSSAKISGLAVQKNGKYLLISHKDMNEIHVLDKTTGALVRKISTFIQPKSLAVDMNDDLWVCYGTASLEKFKINADGTFSTPLLSITGLTDPLALAVSPDNSTVSICDGAASQQVKAYSNTTAASLWVFGVKEGYKTDATVTNDKFYFKDVNGLVFTFIAYQPDGSFWIGDTGNCRVQHYAADRTFINRIMYLPRTYSAGVDSNNPSRVFANYLEFSVDYTKPLAPGNDSWVLTKNWGYNVPSNYNDDYFRLKGVTTLSNGRTYAILRYVNNAAIVELVPGGTMRITNFTAYGLDWGLYKDGSLWKQIYTGGNVVWSKRALTGFDASNNPLYAAEAKVQSLAASLTDPISAGPRRLHGEITSGNIMVSFNGSIPSADGGSRYHLGGVAVGDSKWKWKTAISTHKTYQGEYPKNGAYDIGNMVQYGGNVAMAIERSIIWGYNGEFWKNGQTNKWNQVYDNGLFIGQFGVVTDESAGESAFGMAGNAFAPTVVKAGEDYYLYHNDEGHHGGVHRWKISNLASIAETSTQVDLNMAGRGLLAKYYEGTNLDNFNIKTTRVDSSINFNWATAKPNNTNVNIADNFSASWSGFVAPLYSETYTFYTQADEGVRLWVDGKLLIDKWSISNAVVENSATITLAAGKLYSIRLEYFEQSGNASVALLWSSATQQKSVIPSSQLLADEPTDVSNGINLMENLATKSVLQNNMYGWSRSVEAEDYTMTYYKYWSVKTNVKTANTQSPDVAIRFNQPTGAGTYTVTRNLGTASPNLSNWKLSGNISFEDSHENTTGGGSFLDVLDDAGKVIARVYSKVVYGMVNNQVYTYGNDKLIAQGTSAEMEAVLSKFQNIEVTAAANGVTIKYGPYATVTATVFDPASNWRKPKTLRLSFWIADQNGSNYERRMALDNWKYLAQNSNDATTSPVFTSNGGYIGSVNVAENTLPVTTVCATPSVAGNKLSYSIVGGADKNLFFIDAVTGALTFKLAQDHESPADSGANNTYIVKIRAFDGLNTNDQTLTVNLTDLSEFCPVITCSSTANVNENTVNILTLAANTDVTNAALAYSITGGADAALFQIDAATGALRFKTAPDFEKPADEGLNNCYSVNVKAFDGLNFSEQAIAVTVADVVEAELPATAAYSLKENITAVATLTSNLSASPNPITYSISGGADASFFTLGSTTGALSFKSAPNHEKPLDTGLDNTYIVNVKSSNGASTSEQIITVSIIDQDDSSPVYKTNAIQNVTENQTAIITLAATPDILGTTLAYYIVGGADSKFFSLNTSTGVLTFKVAPDFEKPADADLNNSYLITIRVTTGRAYIDQTFIVNVTDVLETTTMAAGKELLLSNEMLSADVVASLEVLAYPNPTTSNNINLKVSAYQGKSIKVYLTNMLGAVVYREDISTQAGTSNYRLPLHSAFPAGQYILSLSGDGLNKKIRILIN